MRLQLENCSSRYVVKQFTENDITSIYALCNANRTYYGYMKMEPTIENLKEILIELPPNKTMDDKYFVGFYEDNQLVAILDLVTEYPNTDTAYIGWLMINKDLQGTGIGTGIAEELFSFLKKENFQYIELGCIKDNKEAVNFWLKNDFYPNGSEVDTENYTVIGMQKKLI